MSNIEASDINRVKTLGMLIKSSEDVTQMPSWKELDECVNQTKLDGSLKTKFDKFLSDLNEMDWGIKTLEFDLE
jgi:hypothetical protein